MNTDTITIITDPQLLDHDTGGGSHPEVADRIRVVTETLHGGGLADLLEHVPPTPAAREWLLTFHTEAWLFRFEEEVLSGRSYIGHPDNQVCYDTYRVALLSAGSGITGVDLVEGENRGMVFCLTRPPGHHAEAGMPYGFCFLNNCVIAARYWQKKYNRTRICVLDFDAHHGNGIQAAFESEPDTLYISIHEHPSFSYPGTGFAEDDGIGPGAGTILNIPLQPGAGDKEALKQLDRRAAAKIAEFRPEALIVAAGFDGHRQDDMSDLHYSTEFFRHLGERIGAWAHEYCQGRLLSILEGGYHLPVLGVSVETYLDGIRSGRRHAK
jgi:acetoin utilization deacetylase AcuC-like enzyme